MTDKELIRRALLGSREAQRACTDKGIALPCPYCGSDKLYVDAPYRSDDIPAEMINDIDRDYDGFSVSCGCGNYIEVEYGTFKDTLAKWNARPAPPVGRCKDCVWSREPTEEDYKELDRDLLSYKDSLVCDFWEREIWCKDLCSYFEPREE